VLLSHASVFADCDGELFNFLPTILLLSRSEPKDSCLQISDTLSEMGEVHIRSAHAAARVCLKTGLVHPKCVFSCLA
jgi:hypothetical protein